MTATTGLFRHGSASSSNTGITAVEARAIAEEEALEVVLQDNELAHIVIPGEFGSTPTTFGLPATGPFAFGGTNYFATWNRNFKHLYYAS